MRCLANVIHVRGNPSLAILQFLIPVFTLLLALSYRVVTFTQIEVFNRACWKKSIRELQWTFKIQGQTERQVSKIIQKFGVSLWVTSNLILGHCDSLNLELIYQCYWTTLQQLFTVSVPDLQKVFPFLSWCGKLSWSYNNLLPLRSTSLH